MTPKRIFVLDGHPAASSLTRSLAESYANAARGAGHQVRLTHLHDLEFDPDYGFGGYVNQKPLEPGLELGANRTLVHEENIVITDKGARYLSAPAPRTLPEI